MILFQMVLGMIFKDKTARQTLRFFQKQLYLLSQSQIAYENLSLQLETPLKKLDFPPRISSVNMTKSSGNCGYVHIYCRNP